jgi:SAM-dependent methyltransferase
MHQDKSAESEFFDAVTASGGGDYDVLSDRGRRRILRELERHLPARRPLRCLDLGCGTGRFTAHLVRLGLDVHGLDLSPAAVRAARRNVPGATFDRADIEATGLPDASWDVVVLSGVLHHFPDMGPALAECARLLRPGGRLLAYDPHRGNPFMWAYRCRSSPLYSPVGVTPNEQPLGRAAVEQALLRAGFSAVDVRPIGGVSFTFVESGAARLALPVYNAIDRLLDLPPLRRFGSFLISAATR